MNTSYRDGLWSGTLLNPTKFPLYQVNTPIHWLNFPLIYSLFYLSIFYEEYIQNLLLFLFSNQIFIPYQIVDFLQTLFVIKTRKKIKALHQCWHTATLNSSDEAPQNMPTCTRLNFWQFPFSDQHEFHVLTHDHGHLFVHGRERPNPWIKFDHRTTYSEVYEDTSIYSSIVVGSAYHINYRESNNRLKLQSLLALMLSGTKNVCPYTFTQLYLIDKNRDYKINHSEIIIKFLVKMKIVKQEILHSRQLILSSLPNSKIS